MRSSKRCPLRYMDASHRRDIVCPSLSSQELSGLYLPQYVLSVLSIALAIVRRPPQSSPESPSSDSDAWTESWHASTALATTRHSRPHVPATPLSNVGRPVA